MIAVIVGISFQSVSIHLCLQIFRLFSASKQKLPVHIHITYLVVFIKTYYLPQGMGVNQIGKRMQNFVLPNFTPPILICLHLTHLCLIFSKYAHLGKCWDICTDMYGKHAGRLLWLNLCISQIYSGSVARTR